MPGTLSLRKTNLINTDPHTSLESLSKNYRKPLNWSSLSFSGRHIRSPKMGGPNEPRSDERVPSSIDIALTRMARIWIIDPNRSTPSLWSIQSRLKNAVDVSLIPRSDRSGPISNEWTAHETIRTNDIRPSHISHLKHSQHLLCIPGASASEQAFTPGPLKTSLMGPLILMISWNPSVIWFNHHASLHNEIQKGTFLMTFEHVNLR